MVAKTNTRDWNVVNKHKSITSIKLHGKTYCLYYLKQLSSWIKDGVSRMN